MLCHFFLAAQSRNRIWQILISVTDVVTTVVVEHVSRQRWLLALCSAVN